MNDGPPKALLLMRESPQQVFMANTLFRHGVIDGVYVEGGSIGEPDGWTFAGRLLHYGMSGIWQRLVRDVADFDSHYGKLLGYYAVRWQTRDLMSRQKFHDERILGPACRRLDSELQVRQGRSVNEPSCRQLIQERGYRLVFVFGTGLLREDLLGLPDVTFVNLHAGWLPRFRGEGLLSALAEEGVDALGITVHLVDRGIDAGPILCRERLTIEPMDNVYAIGLKATVVGATLFLRVAEDLQRGSLHAIPQDLREGRLYSGRYLKTHFEMRRDAQQALARFRRQATARREEGSRSASYLKRSLAHGAMWSGFVALGRRRHGRRLRILMYHGVLPHVEGPAAFGDLFLSETAFARQMRYLTRAFQVVSLDEVINVLETGGRFPERAVMVTFDDGYRNVITTALPILRSLRIPATVCVVPTLINQGQGLWFDVLRVLVTRAYERGATVELGEGFSVGRHNGQPPESTYRGLMHQLLSLPPDRVDAVRHRVMTVCHEMRLLEHDPAFALAGWEEWRHALEDGLIEIGSHGLTHQDLTQLSPMDRLGELRQSRRRIEDELGRACRVVAYPFGAWDDAVAEAARVAGYACGVTTEDGLNTAQRNPLRLCRTMVGDKGQFHIFCARVSGVIHAARD